MNISNRQFYFLLGLAIALHAVILAAHFFIPVSIIYIAALNGISAFCVLAYWSYKQLTISQHHFELRETAVLAAEIIFICVSIYAIFFNHGFLWVRAATFLSWVIHFAALIVLLLFTLLFKMKKLF